jgi:hypothetical protein
VKHARLVSALLTAAAGLLPLAPAEHAHEIETDGHRNIVVHQHADAHRIAHAPVDREGARSFDHPDDPILTIATVFTTSTPQGAPTPARVTGAVLQLHLVRQARHLSLGLVERMIHGPPRAQIGLRAPPTITA